MKMTTRFPSEMVRHSNTVMPDCRFHLQANALQIIDVSIISRRNVEDSKVISIRLFTKLDDDEASV